MKKANPIRMCIACRLRIAQPLLHRFRIQNGKFVSSKVGRSFYLCDECLKNKDEKNLKKIVGRYTKGSINLEVPNLKENLLNGKC